MIIKYQFKLHISLARIIIGVLFLAFGISMLLGGFSVKSDSDIIFSDAEIRVTQAKKDYNVIFSNMVMDLSDIAEESIGEKVEINVVFGNAEVKIDPDIPTTIVVNSAFGSANTPDGSNIVFGDHTYTTGEGDTPVFRIEANVVFGNLEFVQ